MDKNSFAFIWHSFWLALAESFTDKNSVLPGLILLAGGAQSDVGILTAIMIGVPLISQLIFAALLIKKKYKKNYLLAGIYLRVIAFLGVSFSITFINDLSPKYFVLIIFFWMIIFTTSGAFAGISYNDILGKNVASQFRKKFFVMKQFISSTGILFSVFILKKLLIGYSYPENYKYAFGLAGILLSIGTVAYYFVKEKESIITSDVIGLSKIVKNIPVQLEENKNLKNLIVVSNLIGLSITITPFYIVYSQKIFTLNNELISNFVFYQILGMIISNVLWHHLIKKIHFRGMMIVSIMLYSLIPIMVLVLASFKSLELFSLIFLLVGAAISANRISIDGVFIEISNEANRVLFTGIFGSLNIVSVIFPLLISFFITKFSFQMVFLSISLMTFISLFFATKIDCSIKN